MLYGEPGRAAGSLTASQLVRQGVGDLVWGSDPPKAEGDQAVST